MQIREMEKSQRPREKLLQYGAASLSDAELLAIFLRTGIRGCSAIDLAHYLLQKFGGIRQLLSADRTKFCTVKGLGDAKFVQLQASIELHQRYLQQCLQQQEIFQDVQAAEQFIISKLRDKKYEVFSCLFLDNQHQLIRYEELFRGSLQCASVYPGEVVKQALLHHSAALIIAHNHPSGIQEPSQADIDITKRLQQALMLVDIRLLDHFIIGEGRATSLAHQGFL